MNLKATLSKISPKRMDPKILLVMIVAVALVAVAAVALLGSNNTSANEYKVSFPAENEQIGYTLDYVPVELENGDTVTFKVTVDAKYNASTLVVKANGVILDPIEIDGSVFTFETVINEYDTKIEITVSGYTISYNVNGGSGEVIAMSKQRLVGEEFTVASAASLKAPYTYMEFKEWNTEMFGKGTAYAQNEVVEMTKELGSITLYAIWVDKFYMVTYNANGGEGIIPGVSVQYDKYFTVASADALTAPMGYMFEKWNTEENGNGASYAVGDSVKMIENGITLFAIWEIDPTQWAYVTFYDEDGEMIGSPVYSLKGIPVKPINVTIADPLEMAVWYLDDDRIVELDLSTKLGDLLKALDVEDLELYMKVESQVDRYLADKYVPRPISDAVRDAILEVNVEIVGYSGNALEIFGHAKVEFNSTTNVITITIKGIAMIETAVFDLVYDDGSKAVVTLTLKG
jgi:hypothetical protein